MIQHWRCTQKLCTAWATTHGTKVPHHPCRYTGGLMIPLVRVDAREDVRLVERQDYLRGELAGPVMAAQRVRDDGVDTTVYAPTARADTDDQEAARG